MREIISPDSYLINLSRCAGHALGLFERKKKKKEKKCIDNVFKNMTSSAKFCFQVIILMKKKLYTWI